MPIEEMARRGPRHARLRADAAGRPDRSAHRHARRTPCVQLRQDDAEGRLYNMVGFQTKMTYPEQRRVFRMIPGLAQAEFVRLGSLHRNTYVDSPSLLLPSLQVTHRKRAAARRADRRRRGLRRVGGHRAARRAQRRAPACAASRPLVPPRDARRSARCSRTSRSAARKDFQPMNANYGLFPPLGAAAARAREEARARGARARRPGPLARGGGTRRTRGTASVA